MAPPTNCLAPIGEGPMLQGLKALLVQQHMANEEAKQRRKQSASDTPEAGDAVAAVACDLMR